MTAGPTFTGAAVNVPSALIHLVEAAVGSPPSTARGQRTYEAILVTAERQFVRSDYHAVSVERIASRSKVSVGSVYRYFDSKEGLFLAVLANCLGEMYDAARRAWAAPWEYGYLERLEISTAEYLNAYIKNRKVLGSASHLEHTSERVREMNWAMRGLIHGAMVKRLAEAQDTSNLGPLDVEILMWALSAMVDGYAHRAYVDGEFGSLEMSPAGVERAAKVLSGVWYRSVFGNESSLRS